MLKRFEKILPSNLIKEMYNLNIHKCDFAFMTSFSQGLVLDSYISEF